MEILKAAEKYIKTLTAAAEEYIEISTAMVEEGKSVKEYISEPYRAAIKPASTLSEREAAEEAAERERRMRIKEVEAEISENKIIGRDRFFKKS